MAQGKEHEPTVKTRSEVSALASFGVPQEDIAAYIGISHPTLRKHYQDELAFSAIKANATVGKFLFSLASGIAMKDKQTPATWGDCSRAAMFWAKTRMGWRETNRHEITGADGGALKVETELSDDLRQALDAIAAKIASSADEDEVAFAGPAQSGDADR